MFISDSLCLVGIVKRILPEMVAKLPPFMMRTIEVGVRIVEIGLWTVEKKTPIAFAWAMQLGFIKEVE